MGDLGRLRIRTNCAACVDKCCSQPLNWVYLTEAEIVALEALSGVSREQFVEAIRNEVNGLTFLTLRLPCRFLDSAGRCSVYESRPLICRMFPLYPDPFVTRVSLLPIECGDRLVAAEPDDPAGWSATDYTDMSSKWFAAIWKEAASR